MARPQLQDQASVQPIFHVPRKLYWIERQQDVWFIRFEGSDYGPYKSEREALLFAVDAAKTLGEQGEDDPGAAGGRERRRSAGLDLWAGSVPAEALKATGRSSGHRQPRLQDLSSPMVVGDDGSLMRTDLFDFDLPPDRIALRPIAPRDAARLLVVRPGAEPELDDRGVRDLPDLLRAGDVIVVNDTKVIPGAPQGPAHRPRRRRARHRSDACIGASTVRAGAPSCGRPSGSRPATSCGSARRARCASSASSTPPSRTRATAAR